VCNIKHKNNIRGFHSLRTTFITQRILDGWTNGQISAFTGHNVAKTIFDHYCKTKGVDLFDKIESDFTKREGRVINPSDSQTMMEKKNLSRYYHKLNAKLLKRSCEKITNRNLDMYP